MCYHLSSVILFFLVISLLKYRGSFLVNMQMESYLPSLIRDGRTRALWKLKEA